MPCPEKGQSVYILVVEQETMLKIKIRKMAQKEISKNFDCHS